MTLQIPDGFGQAVATFSFTGGQSNPLAMVFGYSNTTAQTAANAADDIFGRVATAFGGVVFTDQVILQSIAVLQNPGSETGLFVGTAPGGSAGLSAPPSVCALVHKTTTLGGRVGRGRMYWPSVDTGDINEAGVWNGASLDVLQTAMDALRTGLITDAFAMHLLHNSLVIPPTPVSALVADPVVATQRRRLRS